MKKLRLLLIDNLDMPIDTAYRFPQAGVPLGIITISAYVKQQFAGRIEYIDNVSLPLLLHEGKDILQEIVDLIEGKGYDLVGIRSLSAGKEYLDTLTEGIKSTTSAPPIIVGGPYASDSPELILEQHPAVDFVCSKEGEVVFQQFLESWFYDETDEYQTVKGLGYRKNGSDKNGSGKIIMNPPMPLMEDLDILPVPDYDSVDLTRFTSVENPMRIPNQAMWSPIMTQRGCPYHCTYCHEGFGKRSRERGVNHVLEEIFHLYHKQGVKHFAFMDDIFNIRKVRAKEIMRGIIKSGIDIEISFPNGLRGDIIDEELIDLMIEAGTVCIHYAVESASPRIQEWMLKYLKMDKIRKAIDYTSQYDIIFRGFYIVGFPGETEEELNMTIEHAINSGFTETYFNILCMWPGTKIFDAAVQAGFVDERQFTHLTQHDVKNNGFFYDEDLLIRERLRGYGSTHFDLERVRKNFRVCRTMGISKERIIKKEAEYARMIREEYPDNDLSACVPDLDLFEAVLEVSKNPDIADQAFDRIDAYINRNVPLSCVNKPENVVYA